MAAYGWPQALGTLRSLSLSRLQADVVSYNACMKACQGAPSGWRMAFHLLSEMKEAGVAPKLLTYQALLASLPWELAIELLEHTPLARSEQGH